MYTKIKINEILREPEKYKAYKLSFIDDIEETYSDYDEETQRYVQTEQYLKDKELWGWNNPKLRFKCYPSPEYVPGKYELKAFFSQVDCMGDVWGDDHDDAPYSCNAGWPYDSTRDRDEIEVLEVHFALPPDNYWEGLKIKTPRDWEGILNEPWCAEDINLGALPWIWARTTKCKGPNKGVSIMAGTNPYDFIDSLEEIWRLQEESILQRNPDRFTIKYYVRKVLEECVVVEDSEAKEVAFYRTNDLGRVTPLGEIRYDYKKFFLDEYELETALSIGWQVLGKPEREVDLDRIIRSHKYLREL